MIKETKTKLTICAVLTIFQSRPTNFEVYFVKQINLWQLLVWWAPGLVYFLELKIPLAKADEQSDLHNGRALKENPVVLTIIKKYMYHFASPPLLLSCNIPECIVDSKNEDGGRKSEFSKLAAFL